MIRPIVKDPVFLALRSDAAGPEDVSVARDLLDTLEAHRDSCVGMAANMIGVRKRILVFMNEDAPAVMFNPEIVSRSGPYEAEEGCLSLPGLRKATRFRTIKVRFQNDRFQWRQKTFRDFTAQIIQHELDHFSGILI
ncbi:MAG: peptide deformylase [Ruminococcaceae bacterium]|nr:peptide deformylase [Oscillospiraceae bacterium]